MSDFINKIYNEAGYLFAKNINIILDNKIHRFSTTDKPNSINGWYVGSCNEFDQYCIIGNWATDEEVYIFPDNFVKREDSDYLLRLELYKQECLAKEQIIREECEKRSNYLWDNATVECINNPYIIKKQIVPNNIKYNINEKSLLVPLYNKNKKIIGLQRIFENGKKLFTSGTAKGFAFGLINFDINEIENLKFCYLCEGYATANSVWQASNKPVVIAFDCYNIQKTIKTLRDINPEMEIIICADNDKYKEKNSGIECATAAGDLFNCEVKIPEFQDETTQPTDFNDIHCLFGLNNLQEQLNIAKNIDFIKPEKNYFKDIDFLINSSQYKENELCEFCHEETPCILLNPPKNIKMILDWIIDRSMYPQPLLYIMNIISVVGALLGQRIRYVHKGDIRTNIYSIGIAPSGFGKDSSRAALEKILIKLKLQKHLASGTKSDSAIFKALKEGDGRLAMVIDEIGDFLKSLKGATTSWQANITGLLKKLYTSAASDEFTSEKKQTEDDVIINQPLLSLYGLTTEERFVESLTSQETLDGFLSRFIIIKPEICRNKNKKESRWHIDEVPEDILNFFEDIENNMRTNINTKNGKDIVIDDNGSINIIPQEIIISDDVRGLLDAYNDYIDSKVMEYTQQQKIEYTALLNRNFVKVIQIAMICSVKPKLKQQYLDIEAVKYAIALVSFSDSVMLELIDANISNSYNQKMSKKVYNIIKNYCYESKEKMLSSILYNKLNLEISVKDVENLLKDLIQAGKITKEIIESKVYYYPII